MKLTVASSPHIRGNFRTNRIMLDVVIGLLPALAVGIWVLGIRALLITLTCIAGSMAEAYYGVPENLREKCREYLPTDLLDVLTRFDHRICR